MAADPQRISLDCNDSRWGRLFADATRTVQDGGAFLDFMFGPSEKASRALHCGLYFDHAVQHYGRFRYPLDRRVAVLKESPISTTDDTVFLRANYSLVLTHRKALVDIGGPFRELLYGTSWVSDVVKGLSRSSSDHTCAWVQKSEQVSFVGSLEHNRDHGYGLRADTAMQLLHTPGVACFGKGIRYVERKSEALLPYRFSVAMENTRENYYFTEKLVDCFMCETVPIYWGCPSIGRIFDNRGIIQFSELPELGEIICSLSSEKYQEMLPYVLSNRARCFDLLLQDYDAYLVRLARALEPLNLGLRGPLRPWQRGKAMAALRLCKGLASDAMRSSLRRPSKETSVP